MADRDLNQILAGKSDQEVADWLRANKLTPAESNQLLQLIQFGTVPATTANGESIAAMANTEQPESVSAEQDLQRTEAREVTEEGLQNDAYNLAVSKVQEAMYVSRTTQAPFDVPDLKAIIKNAAPHLDTPKINELARLALDEGKEKGIQQYQDEIRQATGASEEEARALAEQQAEDLFANQLGATPRWIIEKYGAPLTEDQKARAVEYWNDLHGTWSLINSFDEDLAPLLETASYAAESVINAAVLDIEPTEAIQIMLPGRSRPYSLSKDQVAAAQQFYGMSNDALTRLVRLTSMYEKDDDALDETWRPLAALMAASGLQERLGQEEQDRQDAAAPEEPPSPDGPEGRVPYTDPETGVVVPGVTVPSEETPTPMNDVPDYLRGDDIAYHIDPTFVSFGNLRMYYNEGLEQYNGSRTLAFLHAMDRGLAARLAASGGDPGKVSGNDNNEAIRLLVKGGLISHGSSTPFTAIGGIADDAVLPYLQNYFESLKTEEQLKADAEGEAKAQRVLPDPAAIREQMTQLWQSMFRRAPTDAEISEFTESITNIVQSAPMNQNIDVSARIQQSVRGSSIYGELYGNKPEGMSEGEYQNQFIQGAADMLGSEAPAEEAILAGMRSGEYQTTIGRVAADPNSLDNSRFRERLAEATRAIAEKT